MNPPAPQCDASPAIPPEATPDLHAAATAPRAVVPIIEEELEVERRQVETGRVIVHKRVTEEQVLVERPMERTEVQVERVPINRFVEVAPPVREEGDTTIIPVLEEVVVVEKRLMLKEEVRLTRHTTTTTSRQTVTLRSEQAEVERVHRFESRPADPLAVAGQHAAKADTGPDGSDSTAETLPGAAAGTGHSSTANGATAHAPAANARPHPSAPTHHPGEPITPTGLASGHHSTATRSRTN